MSGPGYTILTLDLTSAGSQAIDGPWELVRFLDAVDGAGNIQATARISVVVGRAVEDSFPQRVGNAVRMKPAAKVVTISWTAQAGITAKIGFSSDAAAVDWDADPPAQVATISGEVAVREAPADTILVTSNDVAQFATLTVAARTARRSVVLQADVANTAVLWVRHAGAGAIGYRLEPGGQLVLDTTAAVEVHNPSTGTKTALVIELYDA